MTDAEMRNCLEGIAHELYNLVGHKADDSPIWQYIEDLAAALEANPPLAEVEGWAYVAHTCVYIGADGMIMIRRETLPDVKEGDQLTVTIREGGA